MVFSRYNIAVPAESGTYIINTYSGSLVRVSPELAAHAEDAQVTPESVCSADEIAILSGNGILCESHRIEVDSLKCKALGRRFATNSLGVTFAPTMDCNLACVYCYEKAQTCSRTMDSAIIDASIGFVERKLANVGALSVTYYGGEPLLKREAVFELSARLGGLCRERDVRFTQSLVTNGTLLTKSVAARLYELGVTGIQVTIDGPRHIHDAMRPYRHGSTSTYDRILDNLVRVSDIVNVGLRVNLDRANQSAAMQVLKDLSDRGLASKLDVYPAQIEPANECHPKDSCLTTAEFARASLEFRKELMKLGFRANLMKDFPRSMRLGCVADRINGAVIDPDGDIYKCWHDIGVSERSIGNVVRNKVKANDLFFDYMLYDPFEDAECKDCRLLPICMGGCAFRRVEDSHIRCIKLREDSNATFAFLADNRDYLLNEIEAIGTWHRDGI